MNQRRALPASLLRWWLAGIIASGLGCHVPRKGIATIPAPDERRARADELVSVGCYRCLRDAVQLYEALLKEGMRADGIEQGAHDAYLMRAMREAELGIPYTETMARARELGDWSSIPGDIVDLTLDVLAEQAAAGWTRLDSPGAISDAGARLTLLRGTQQPPRLVAAYAAVSLDCVLSQYRDRTEEPQGRWDTTIADDAALRYAQLRCAGGFSSETARAILDLEPRFGEVRVAMGLDALGQGLMMSAYRELGLAHDIIPESSVIAVALADVALGLGRFDEALRLYDGLRAGSRSPDAMLGRAKALTYLNRHSEAIGVLNELLQGSAWKPGEIHYWRAWNFLQVAEFGLAHESAMKALALWTAPHVYRLAGLTAMSLSRLAEARRYLETALKSSADDCESMSYLAQIDSRENRWNPALDRFAAVAACCARALTGLMVAPVPGASADLSGADTQNAAAAAEIAQLKALQSSSIYNAAIAAKVLGRREAALEYAKRLLADPTYQGLARDFILDIDVPARVGI